MPGCFQSFPELPCTARGRPADRLGYPSGQARRHRPDLLPPLRHLAGHVLFPQSPSCSADQSCRAEPEGSDLVRLAIHHLLARNKFRNRGKFLYMVQAESLDALSRERRSAIPSTVIMARPNLPARSAAGRVGTLPGRAGPMALNWSGMASWLGLSHPPQITPIVRGEGNSTKPASTVGHDGTGGKRKTICASGQQNPAVEKNT